jgi:hypothetical protein
MAAEHSISSKVWLCKLLATPGHKLIHHHYPLSDAEAITQNVWLVNTRVPPRRFRHRKQHHHQNRV